MVNDDDISIVGTTESSVAQKLTDKERGQEFAVEYLKADFLASSANALFHIRRLAGLTQTEIAERLNTKQSAIARLEADFDGSMTLRRFVEFALACGMAPHHITFAPVVEARDFVIAQPDKVFTPENHLAWVSDKFRLSLEPAGNFSHSATIDTSATTLKEAKLEINAGGAQVQVTQFAAKADKTMIKATYAPQEMRGVGLPASSQREAA